MKISEITLAVGFIDDDLIIGAERSKSKKIKKLWVKATVAACILLAVFSVILPTVKFLDMLRNGIEFVPKRQPTSPPTYYGSDDAENIGSFDEVNTSGISVTARLKETLPDTYTFFDDWDQTEFRLLKMEVVTLLKGDRMTEEFYYIVPLEYMTDYSLYDKFVIVDMGQYGYEYSVLYNKTKGCAEQLNTVLFGYLNLYIDYIGSEMMAFDENGNFDGALWVSTERWRGSTGWPDKCDPKYKEGYTLKQAEEEYSKEDKSPRYVHLLVDISGKAKETLEYIRSIENGIFVTSGDGFKAQYDPEIQLGFRRYINGFPTNESGTIYAATVDHSKARFTVEEEAQLPDLASAISAVAQNFAEGKIEPPHIKNYRSMTNTVYGIFGWYAKTEEGMLGVIRVTWCYRSDDYDVYFDDKYYAVECGSEICSPIDRDSLLEKFGEYETTYIYDGEYDIGGKAVSHEIAFR